MFRSKSSKATKCKNASRMTVSRIKLLRNKRETQLKHLKADIARLLETKQEENARSRVDHAIREQNMIEAYGIIENCCELLISRAANISLQKTCPQDLLEPIANLVYAAPRCGDLPELQDIRSVCGDKYGKHFLACIVELREGCGVSKKMIEKLSTHQVSIEKKVGYMAQVAAEFNVKWTPTRDIGADEVRQPKPATKQTPASVDNMKKSDVGSPKSPLQVEPIPVKQPVVESESSEDEPVKEVPQPKRGAVSQGDKQFIPFAVTKQPSPRASNKDPRPDPYSQFAGNRLNPYEAAPARSRVNPYENGATGRTNPYEAAPAAMNSRLNPYEAAVPAPSINPYEAPAPASKNRQSSYEAEASVSARPSHHQLNSPEVTPAGSPRETSGSRASDYKRTLLSGSYSDVASAAEAAAESAEHAAAAARIAAELANKELSRASSGSSSGSSRPSHASRIEVPQWKEKVESYIKSHVNDSDSPEWGTPSVRTPISQELNPNRRWEKETITSSKPERETLASWNSTGIFEKESKTNFWRANLDESGSDAQVEFLKSSVAAEEDADELFRATPAKLPHSSDEKQVSNDRSHEKPVFDDYNQAVHRPDVQLQPDRQPVFDEEPIFDEHRNREPAFNDRPAFDEHQPFVKSHPVPEQQPAFDEHQPFAKSHPVPEKQPPFDEQPVLDQQFSRLDSVTLGLQTMGSKFAELYASSDEEEKPSTRNRQSGGGREGKQDVNWKQHTKAENIHRELGPSESNSSRYHDDVSSSSRKQEWNGRASGWRMNSRGDEMPSDSSSSSQGSRLNLQRQFHGAGVDHTESPASTMRKHRLPAASVRTRKGL